MTAHRCRRALALTILVGFALMPSAMKAQQSAMPAEVKRIQEKVQQVLEQTEVWRGALTQLSDKLDGALLAMDSMVDLKELSALQDATFNLNRLQPNPLPDLFTKDQIRSLAAAPGNAGTVTGANIEKRRLRKVRDERRQEIAALKEQRDRLKASVNQGQSDLGRIQSRADMIGDKLLTPEIEIVALAGGKSVYASWYDLKITVTEAMIERNNAADNAIMRLNAVIDHADKDVDAFSDAISFVEFLFPDDVRTPPGPPPDARAQPGNADLYIQELESRMKSEAHAATQLSNQLRQQASEIDAHNARIDRLTTFLGVASTVLGAASGSSSDSSQATPPPATPPANVKVLIINQQNNWIVKQAPAAGGQKPIKQQPIDNPPKG